MIKCCHESLKIYSSAVHFNEAVALAGPGQEKTREPTMKGSRPLTQL